MEHKRDPYLVADRARKLRKYTRIGRVLTILNIFFIARFIIFGADIVTYIALVFILLSVFFEWMKWKTNKAIIDDLSSQG